MNLADMLSYADIHELGRIARNYDCDCSSHSKNALIQSILSTLGRKDVFESQVRNMGEEDIRFLNSLLFDRRDSFSLEELLARANQTQEAKKDSGWNPKELILRFKERGWLFNGYSQQTKYLFQVPEDLKRRFSDTLARTFMRKLQLLQSPPGVYRDEQGMLQDDIVKLLRLLEQADMPLNPEGFIYKRQLQQILEQLSVPEQPVPKTAWRFGYGRRFREYPIRFSFLYDYCYYQGLIEEKDNCLRLTPAGGLVLSEGRRENVAELYRFWLRLFRGPIPNLLSLVHWMEKLAGGWVTTASLGEVICPLISAYYYDTPQDIYTERILPMLMHLGLMRIGADDAAGSAVQMSVLGQSVIKGVYVPDETVIKLEMN